ncbi:arginine deiminase-related protein [Pseudoxanthomonas sp.]|uniref:dimethylarginine dimethylaminohydrolase family protein n=1 Tax=Pseudoxanthomonas sp. TaxID=1871049 RepID=UPI00260BF978|nr:arginine deiminase-related protein [Pseudoxanthomonas sp.]WDS35182.1 MAG: arginine deiminase-related protein [Pseudoxanthomonas sp.]
MSTSPRPRVLMCPPTHFSVEYDINPWMTGNRDQADRARAGRQWDDLRALVADAADVELIEHVPGLPDMVFTANAGLVYRDVAVPSRFRHAERAGEEAHFTRWFSGHRFDVDLLDGIEFEGAGDALLDRAASRLWFGYGHRSDARAAGALHALLGIDVVPLRLVDPRFYHLDTCLCPLSGGHLLYFPAAFDEAAQAAIAARVPADKRIAVSEEDALAFACNAVNLDNVVILNRATPALRAQLEQAGYRVRETPLDEFLKAGGSAKCLTLRLDEPGLA